jgi:hypothetical protein
MTTVLYDLPSIELDELVRRAALLTRVDRKYLLAVSDLPALLHGLGNGVRVLEMHSRREFAYRSTYFDTPECDAYLATVRRRRRRFKVRIRSYLDSDQHFLEVKTTGVRGATVKHRVPHRGDGLDARAHAHIDTVLAQAGMPGDRSALGWALTNTYRRTTLYVPAADGRATIDTEPAWALPHGPAVTVPGLVIVETKSSGAPGAIDRLLWSLGHRPWSISKFGVGMALLRPDLPANRWLRVLRRYFAAGPRSPREPQFGGRP